VGGDRIEQVLVKHLAKPLTLNKIEGAFVFVIRVAARRHADYE
jgi:hypothetical protein